MNKTIEAIRNLPDGEPLYYPRQDGPGFKSAALDTDALKALIDRPAEDVCEHPMEHRQTISPVDRSERCGLCGETFSDPMVTRPAPEEVADAVAGVYKVLYSLQRFGRFDAGDQDGVNELATALRLVLDHLAALDRMLGDAMYITLKRRARYENLLKLDDGWVIEGEHVRYPSALEAYEKLMEGK